MQFDRNGVNVRTTVPRPTLRKLRRVVTIDSRDRDPTKLLLRAGTGAGSGMISDAGDFVVYLPRPMENVTSIRLMSAEIAVPQTDVFTVADRYILLELEGLNKMDETAPGADRAGLVDSAFAKIPTNNATAASLTANTCIYYNDKSAPENITHYNPPISNLNRIHATWRRHRAFAAADPTTPYNKSILFGTSENSITLEIEYLDNGFDSFSSFETHL